MVAALADSIQKIFLKGKALDLTILEYQVEVALKRVGFISLVLVVILLTGVVVVSADIGPGNSVETQKVSVVTKVSATGSYTKEDSMAWRSSNEWLDVNGYLVPSDDPPFYTWVFTAEPPMNDLGEVQMTSRLF